MACPILKSIHSLPKSKTFNVQNVDVIAWMVISRKICQI